MVNYKVIFSVCALILINSGCLYVGFYVLNHVLALGGTRLTVVAPVFALKK